MRMIADLSRIRRLLRQLLPQPAAYLLRHRQLVWLLARRDVASRTSGTLLGGLWMLIQPALQVVALWFLLDIVLKVRFPGLRGGFVAYYLTGMIPWLMMNEIIQRSLSVLTEFAVIYQRAVFPLGILPLVPLFVTGGIYMVIYVVVGSILAGAHGGAGAALLIALLLLWLLPFCYLLAVLGLFVRDLQQVSPFVLTMFLYVTPILYLPAALPPSLHWWLLINPFAHLMAMAHGLV